MRDTTNPMKITPQVHNVIPVVRAYGLGIDFYNKNNRRTTAALCNIDLTVSPSAFIALVGPDGAGKSTFLRTVSGLIQADRGKVEVFGVNMAENSQLAQNRIGYMPQKFGLYEDLSVQENIDLYADLHGVPHSQRPKQYARLLSMTNLSAFTARLAGKLSGGMKQKLGLICALVRTPELLLLDEPTAGVDPLSRRELWEIIGDYRAEEKITVIASTTYFDEAALFDEVIILNQGEIIGQGAPAHIAAKAAGLCYSALPEKNENVRSLQTRLFAAPDLVLDAVPRGGGVHFVRKPGVPFDQMASLLQGAECTEVKAQLEDAVMMLFPRHENPQLTLAQPVISFSPVQPNGKTPVIEVRDVVRKFGDFTAVAGTTFSVYEGEVFGLLGPNGAGKTTTFRMLCGLLPASSGYLHVAGADLRTAMAEARKNVGYVSQKFSLYGALTVRENIQFFGSAYGLYGSRLRDRMKAVLEQFALEGKENVPAAKLAGGLKQRRAMAVGILHEPAILFLDEPTSGADILARRAFWKKISSLASEGTTIIITTHFMEEAEYCDRVLIQDAGKVLALGTPKEVQDQAAGLGCEPVTDMENAFIKIVESVREKEQAGAELAEVNNGEKIEVAKAAL